MFIFTAKLTKKKIICAVVVAAILLCGLIVFAATRGGSSSAGGLIGESVNEAAKPLASRKNVKTNEDRVNFLKAYGWSVDENPLETQEVRIPKKFNEVYEKYNELQAPEGFDLKKYAGKTVKRYTYTLENYPSQEDDVIITLLIYKDTVIGGDIMSTRLDGFMHGLSKNKS